MSLPACTIRLEPGTTKNDEGGLVYLTPELVEMLQAQDEQVRILEMHLYWRVEWLFLYLSGEHKGERIQDFRKTWKTACLEAMLAGLEGEAREKWKAEVLATPDQGLLKMLRNDFRRTAVRNMVNRGVPERVAMKITGQKPAPCSTRYHIVTPGGSSGGGPEADGHVTRNAKWVPFGTPCYFGGADRSAAEIPPSRDGTRTRDLSARERGPF